MKVERQTADWFGVSRYELSGLIKDGELLDQLRDCWLIKTNSAAWSSDVFFSSGNEFYKAGKVRVHRSTSFAVLTCLLNRILFHFLKYNGDYVLSCKRHKCVFVSAVTWN